MKKTITGCSNPEILKQLNLDLDIKGNVYNIPLKHLFSIAARKNPKRNFLFVSKLLGKHIAVHPQIPRISGVILADLFLRQIEGYSPYNADILTKALISPEHIENAVKEIERVSPRLSTPTLFLGFAETATGLAHAMFSAFDYNANFIHTTREEITELKSSFNFEEEHSHATSHLCFALDKDYFNKFKRIILIDDEITTGKTTLNLIRSLNKHFPNKEFVMVSILDWRKEEEIQAYRNVEKEMGIKINEISLIQGSIQYEHKPMRLEETETFEVQQSNLIFETVELPLDKEYKYNFNCTNSLKEQKVKLYYKLTGRFGMDTRDNEKLEEQADKFADKLRKYRKYNNCLCVGFGEHIYVPSRISARLGENVLYQSITRSPIYSINKDLYPIKDAIPFSNPEDTAVKNYIYNILPNQYEEVFIFLERDIDIETKSYIAEELSKRNIKSLVFVAFS